MKIRDVIERDLGRKIEEIIKVDQTAEQAVLDEMSEYVVTDGIREDYRTILRAIADAPEDPDERVGVWISGFFGSGKSSFAKNLGYALANRDVAGKRAAQVLKERLDDRVCSSLLDSINQRIPTRIVMFDVQTDKAVGGTGTGSISRYMYKALLRELEYAEDFDVAALEQQLEHDGKLAEFTERFKATYGDWRVRRKMALRMSEASAILHQMDPSTYRSADSWANTQSGTRIEATPGFLVEQTFALGAQRAKGQAIVYVVDEVGAYVARNQERIEDLRRVVELFGSESKKRRKAREVVGPTWVVVTSQEKLDEVVAAIDGKRVELAKMQDRFHYRIDLAPADIREVASRRVLAKHEAGRKALMALYAEHEGELAQHLALERTHRKTGLDGARFAAFYPYPPHLLELSIDIMSGIRLQPGAARHLGGSNRTIIKQAYEMLVSERTRLADAPLGTLVTIDRIFDLVEGNLSTERRKDISDVTERLGPDHWPTRVGKAIALLEFVSDLPRTDANIAALLHDNVRGGSCIQEVRAALERLHQAQFVRRSDDGWKLQTAVERKWDDERRNLDPKLRDRATVVREVLGTILDDPKLRRYQYGDLKQLTVGLTIDGQRVGADSQQIPLFVATAADVGDLERVASDTQALTRQRDHANELHWVFALTPEIDDLSDQVCRSRQMIQKYELLRGQSSSVREHAESLAAERHEEERHTARLRDRLGVAFDGGTAFFRGISRDAAALGKTRVEILRSLFDETVPQLYPKLRMGARPIVGNEADEILKAANLTGLPQVFYDGESGLALVVSEGGKLVPNPAAPIAKEVLDHLRHESSIGEKVSGKDLERKFAGIGYGWEREIVQLVLAVLLRAGAIEVTHQNKRFRSHLDPLCREPLTKTHAFRASTFAPRESVGLKTLGAAARRLEAITGGEVDVEEAAIARELKRLAGDELGRTVPLRALAQALHLPVQATLWEYETTLKLILESPSDDCVRILAGEGSSLETAMKRVGEIRAALTEQAVADIQLGRQVGERLGPEILALDPQRRETVDALTAAIAADDIHRRVPKIVELTNEIDGAYGKAYATTHATRDEAFDATLASIRARADWLTLPEDVAKPVLQPIQNRRCGRLDRTRGALVCTLCRATLPQMESDVAAVDVVVRQVVDRIAELVTPEQKVERVRVADLIEGPVDSEESVENLLRTLRTRLLKLIESGARIVVE